MMFMKLVGNRPTVVGNVAPNARRLAPAPRPVSASNKVVVNPRSKAAQTPGKAAQTFGKAAQTFSKTSFGQLAMSSPMTIEAAQPPVSKSVLFANKAVRTPVVKQGGPSVKPAVKPAVSSVAKSSVILSTKPTPMFGGSKVSMFQRMVPSPCASCGRQV